MRYLQKNKIHVKNTLSTIDSYDILSKPVELIHMDPFTYNSKNTLHKSPIFQAFLLIGKQPYMFAKHLQNISHVLTPLKQLLQTNFIVKKTQQ